MRSRTRHDRGCYTSQVRWSVRPVLRTCDDDRTACRTRTSDAAGTGRPL